MAFGGIGARGEIHSTTDNDLTRRLISIRIAASMAVAANLITLGAYLVVWLYWWFVLINEYAPPAWYVSGWSRWWGCVRYVASTWAQPMGKTWPLWSIPLPLAWVHPLWTLYRQNLYPKLLNDGWPPPWAQMPPLESGAITWNNMDARSSVGRKALQAGPITMPTTKRNGTHTQYRYPQIPTPKAGREQLARWFWRIVRQGGEGFSQGVAQDPYRIQRKECKAIQDVFIVEQWATDRGGTQGIRPNALGLDKMWEVVLEIYPTAPLPPDRAQGV